MKFSASPFVVRVWMPMLFVAGEWLFFDGGAPGYWLLALPLLLVSIFMSTLADVKDDGNNIVINTLWRSIRVPKQDVVRTRRSMLDEIGVLQLRRYVLPWGRVYFVSDWSQLGVVYEKPEDASTDDKIERRPLVRTILESLAVAISGLVAARVISTPTNGPRIQLFNARIAAFAIAGALFVVFVVSRERRPSFANVALFGATWIAGLAGS